MVLSCRTIDRPLAKKRLKQLKKRFQRNPEFAAGCKAIMNDYIVSGYAVELFKEEADSRRGHTGYLPHHGVP